MTKSASKCYAATAPHHFHSKPTARFAVPSEGAASAQGSPNPHHLRQSSTPCFPSTHIRHHLRHPGRPPLPPPTRLRQELSRANQPWSSRRQRSLRNRRSTRSRYARRCSSSASPSLVSLRFICLLLRSAVLFSYVSLPFIGIIPFSFILFSSSVLFLCSLSFSSLSFPLH